MRVFCSAVLCVLSVLLVACSSSSKPLGPCALRNGTYRVSSSQTNGTCGIVSDDITQAVETQSDIGATEQPKPPCTGTVKIAADNCSTELDSIDCPIPATGGHSVSTGRTDWSNDGSSGSGEVGITEYDPNGATVCQSTYAMVWAKQQ